MFQTYDDDLQMTPISVGLDGFVKQISNFFPLDACVERTEIVSLTTLPIEELHVRLMNQLDKKHGFIEEAETSANAEPKEDQ